MEDAEAFCGKTRPRDGVSSDGAELKRARADKASKMEPDISLDFPAMQPVRESSCLSDATTRAAGSDDTDSDKDKNEPPPLFARRQSSSGSLDKCLPRTFSSSMLQVQVTPFSSPLGVQRLPSAAGYHLSCPFQDLMQLEKGISDDNDAEPVASPSTMTSITTVSEELKAIEDMKKVQEKAKRAVREHVDAKYNRRHRKQAMPQAASS